MDVGTTWRRVLSGGACALLLAGGAVGVTLDEDESAVRSDAAMVAPRDHAAADLPAFSAEATAPATGPLRLEEFLEPVDLAPAPQVKHSGGETVSGAPSLETAGGIVVHERLAPIIWTLLAEAETAGVLLEGGGYRNREAQRRLREQNCPDPVNSPPAECSPPTARVGESYHQVGLAIDFTSDGALIVDRDHPAYRFLEANASWTGLAPHPSEPWHWSYRG